MESTQAELLEAPKGNDVLLLWKLNLKENIVVLLCQEKIASAEYMTTYIDRLTLCRITRLRDLHHGRFERKRW